MHSRFANGMEVQTAGSQKPVLLLHMQIFWTIPLNVSILVSSHEINSVFGPKMNRLLQIFFL